MNYYVVDREDLEALGYELVRVEDFMDRAPSNLVNRFREDCEGNGDWVLYDPFDNEDGFMVCGESEQELLDEFNAHHGQQVDELVLDEY